MTEVTGLAELFKLYGPLGFSVIMMGGGLVYLLRWLRSEQDRSEAERKEAHTKFGESLEKLAARHEAITQITVTQFTNALDRQGERLDKIEDRLSGYERRPGK